MFSNNVAAAALKSILLIVGLAAMSSSSAQEAQAPHSSAPDLTVSKAKWGPGSLPAWGWDRSIRDTPIEHANGVHAQRPELSQGSLPASRREGFRFEAKVKNTGQKTVSGVRWDYVTIDTKTRKELERLKFYSKVRIKPGREQVLSNFRMRPPQKIIDATAEAEEKVEIMEINYRDGSRWAR